MGINKNKNGLSHYPDLLKYIIEHTNSAVAVHDRDMKYMYVSQRYLRDYNVVEKDVIGKHHYDVFPDLPQKWRDVHKKVLAGEILSADNDKYVREDGTEEWTRWECRPWYQPDNKIGGLIVYTEVITDRVKEKVKLRESEEIFRHFMEKSPIYVFFKDKDLRSIKLSMNYEQLLGRPMNELLGKTTYDMFPSDLAKKIVEYDKKVLNEGQTVVVDEEFNGRIYTTIKFPIKINGDPRYLAGYTIDITDQKNSEREITKLKEGLEEEVEKKPQS